MILQRLGQRDLDAAWFWEPNLDKAVKEEVTFYDFWNYGKRGYPTWDVGVVMKSFAKKYPEYVEKFVKAECAGIDFWINNPAKTAKIIAEELSLDLEDATRMMKGTEMVPCKKQLTSQYMGTSDDIGGFADTLVKTSKFLVSQKRLPKQLKRKDYEKFLDPSYLEKVVD